MKTHCSICDRNFKNEEAFAMHNQAKHNTQSQTSSSPISSMNFKKIRNWTIFIIILVGIIYLISLGFSAMNKESLDCKTAPATEINIGGHANLKLHIHSNLIIKINEVQYNLPANIGVATGILRPLHTHDPDNKVHIEGPCARDFKLGEFFQVWNKEFNENQIFDYATPNGTLTMTVNGVPNTQFENYVMRDEDKIVIEYKSN